jgi:hypothetical protein
MNAPSLPLLFCVLCLLGVTSSGCGDDNPAATGDAASPDSATDAPPAAPDAGAEGAADTGTDAPGSGAFEILHSFDGDSYTTGPTGRGKPEMNLAANGTQVTQVTWQHVNVYDYTGTTLKSTSLQTFITGAGLSPLPQSVTTPYEPHVVFDEFIQRWIITASCAYDCVLVSDGADATTTNWQGFYLDNNGNDPAMHIGYDVNGVYFAEGVVSPSSVDTGCCSSNVFAIPSAEVQWTTTLNPTHRNKLTGKPLETMPLIDNSTTKAAGAPAFFVAKTCPPNNSCQGNSTSPITNLAFQWIVSYGVWSGTTFTWTSNHASLCAGGAAPSDQCVRTDPDGVSDRWLFNTPIDPPQPGTSTLLRGAEIHRILGAMQQGNHLHVAMGSGPCVSSCGAHGTDSGADIFIWADLDCSTPGACKVYQTQKGSTADHLLWPTIGVDPSGNVAVFTNMVNATSTYLGIEAWTHAATDPLGALTAVSMPVMSGTVAYNCSGQTTAQTGNPAGVSSVRDPLDPTALWVTEQYSTRSGSCQWNTRVVEYRP